MLLIAATPIPLQLPSPSPREQHQTPATDSGEHESNAKADLGGADTVPLVVKTLPSQNAGVIAAAQSGNQKEEPSEDWWLVVPTWLLAIFTAGLFAYTARLWGATNAMVEDAKQNAIRQLRAYVYLEVGARPYPPESPNRYSTFLRITNTGSTWARNVVILQKRVHTPTPPSDPFDELTGEEFKGGKQLFGPGQTIELQFGDIRFIDVPQLLSGQLNLDYVAWVIYEDSLSNPPIRRQTQISMHLNGDAEGGISFSFRPTHNCADEDCN